MAGCETLRRPAARLMLPAEPGAPAGDHWWFPATAAVEGKTFEVEAQLVRFAGGEGLRVRFERGDGPAGVRAVELRPASPSHQVRDLIAREGAADIGLLTTPGGFAHLRINGASPTLVHWRESNSTAMLQRLGMPRGEIFRAQHVGPLPRRPTYQ